ncbi:MAG TPA: NUDIX domain-containing protein [Acidimicrobiales bacterium]|nr:NUDIX domain-containing protein [Acidimicrobiales bacterium]
MSRQIQYDAAGVVLSDASGRVLVLRRTNEVRLPKGHIEPDEDAVTAAVRELREESGYVDVEVVRPLGTKIVEFDYDSPTSGPTHVRRSETYFAATALSSSRVESEPQFVVEWLQVDEAVQALTFEAERDWVRRAFPT